jgi:putative membrane protein
MKVLVALLLTSLPALALAQYSNPDKSFYGNAAQGGRVEVAAGKLAQKNGASQAVKDFGAMMVEDHSASNKKLKKLADSKSVKLPEGPSLSQKAKLKMLEMKSGSSFDKDYIEGQVKAHKETLELLKKEIDSGQDADAKAFASEILPTVEAHLAKIKQIAADSGVKTADSGEKK